MLSFDTNNAVYAANIASPFHPKAARLIQALRALKDVVIRELVLVEL